jgi:hypothetical protein
MPKKLKTLERNEGKAPLLVPHPAEEDENFRQLSLRFLHSRQWRSPGTTLYTHQCIMLVAGPGAPVSRVAKGVTVLDNSILSKVCWCDR